MVVTLIYMFPRAFLAFLYLSMKDLLVNFANPLVVCKRQFHIFYISLSTIIQIYGLLVPSLFLLVGRGGGEMDINVGWGGGELFWNGTLVLYD